MPWTETTRGQYRRDDLRYASDMTDAEWALIEPHLPPPRRLGRPRTTELRSVVDGLLYILATGCQWRLLPRDFPPYSTVQRFFYRWREDGLWQVINHALVRHAREAQGRAASPSAGGHVRRGHAANTFAHDNPTCGPHHPLLYPPSPQPVLQRLQSGVAVAIASSSRRSWDPVDPTSATPICQASAE